MRARASGLRDRIALSSVESAFKRDCSALLDQYAAPPSGSPTSSSALASSPLSQPCERVTKWLAQGAYAERPGFTPGIAAYDDLRTAQLLQDEYFAPLFGRTYDRFSLAEINDLRLQVLSCNVGGPDKRHLLEVFSVDAYPRNVTTVTASRPASEELDGLLQSLDDVKDSADPTGMLRDLDAVAQPLARKAPGRNAVAFYDRIAAIRHERASAADRTKVEDLIRTGSTLVDLINLNDSAQSIDQRMTTLSAQPDADQWTRLRGRLGDKLHDLSATLAAQELASYRAVESTGESLDNLAKATHSENEAQRRFGSLLRRPEFAALNQEISAYRPKVLARQSATLAANISRQTEPQGVTAVLDQYIVATDSGSAGGAMVQAAAEKRYDELLPFRHLRGGLYLSTVYRGDKIAVDRADGDYTKDVRMALVGGVNGVLAGRSNPLLAQVDAALSKVTMLEPVLAVYLMSYQDTSSRCLRPGYETVSTQTTTTLVRRNGYGMETARQVLRVDVSHYKVNKEFASTLRQLATADTDSAAVGDALLNGNKLNDLLAGTRDMMQQFPCDDPRIVRWEKNALELYKSMDK